MKKLLIGALVGGLILFIWQFLSWGMLNLHGSNMQYTPAQDQVLTALDAAGLAEGTYFLPNVPPGTPMDQHEKLMEPRTGKSWAIVSYHKSLNMAMGMNMFRGFIVDFLAALFLCYIFMGFSDLTFQKVLVGSIMVGLIGYLSVSYLNSIWFEGNSIPDLIDAIVSWGLVGAWLGFWLNRN